MVCGGEEGEGTGPNHRPTGMLRDRRVFIFKRPDIIIVIIIIVRELITPFRSKNYGHCLFPFFFFLFRIDIIERVKLRVGGRGKGEVEVGRMMIAR